LHAGGPKRQRQPWPVAQTTVMRGARKNARGKLAVVMAASVVGVLLVVLGGFAGNRAELPSTDAGVIDAVEAPRDAAALDDPVGLSAASDRRVAVAAPVTPGEAHVDTVDTSDAGCLLVRISGGVMDRRGRPIAGATVRVATAAEVQTTESAADGRYEVAVRWRPATFRVEIAATKVGRRAAQAQVPAAAITKENTRFVRDLRMRDGRTIRGRVLHRGQPVAGAIVEFGRRGRRCSDATGTFYLPIASGAEALHLHIGHGECGVASRSYETMRTDDLGDIELRPTTLVGGQVLFVDNQPARGLKVMATAKRGDGHGGLRYWAAWTDEHGRFEIQGMANRDRRILLEDCIDASGAQVGVAVGPEGAVLRVPGVVAVVTVLGDAADAADVEWEAANAVATRWQQAAGSQPTRRIVPFGSSWKVRAIAGEWSGQTRLEVPAAGHAPNEIDVVVRLVQSIRNR